MPEIDHSKFFILSFEEKSQAKKEKKKPIKNQVQEMLENFDSMYTACKPRFMIPAYLARFKENISKNLT